MMTGRFRVRCPGCGNVTDINTDIPCPKHIGNKETVSYSVPFGTHNVRMTAGMSRKCVDMTLTLTPQAPVGYLKAHIKPGFISNTVVIEPALPQDMPV